MRRSINFNLGLTGSRHNQQNHDHHHHHHHHLWHESPLWAIAFLGFPDNRIFMGWGCQPHAQPPTRGMRPLYLWPEETGWPSYTPRHWVPIFVTSYDMPELCWDYPYPPVATRRNWENTKIKLIKTITDHSEHLFCTLISFRTNLTISSLSKYENDNYASQSEIPIWF
jgi:hypothetical protein